MEPTPTWYASDTKLHSNPPFSPPSLCLSPSPTSCTFPYSSNVTCSLCLYRGCLPVEDIQGRKSTALYVWTCYFLVASVWMMSCACGGSPCFHSCWYNECFWELMAVTKQALRKEHSLPMSFSMLDLLFVKLFETDALNKVFRGVDQWFPNPSWPEHTK